MEKRAVRVVVIDPDPHWQQAVTAALTDANVSVVASSSDPSQAAELADAHAADLLLGVEMPRSRFPSGRAVMPPARIELAHAV